MTATASPTWSEQEAVQKVLRRAEVSRLARALQNRLALATFKTIHGLENLDLDTIEPRLEDDFRRKRGLAQIPDDQDFLHSFEEADLEWMEDGENCSYRKTLDCSVHRSRSSSRKRPGTSLSDQLGPPRKRPASFKENQLPVASEDGESKQVGRKYGEYSVKAGMNSSPPQTPPRRAMRTPVIEEGVDLLLYFATSPPPAQLITKSRFTPSTPPSKLSFLQSSVMTSAGAPETPAQPFNFADFVNVTPSPAQAAFPSRPTRTPATIARRRLDFDQIAPPAASPMNLRLNGIGILELGELISSK